MQARGVGPVAVWSSHGGFARRLLDTLRGLGLSGLIPRGERECLASRSLLLDLADAPLAPRGCLSHPGLVAVDRGDVLGSVIRVVEALKPPREYLLGIDPGERRTGLALMARGFLVHGEVLRSVHEAARLACHVAGRVTAPLLVGVGYSPASRHYALQALETLQGCGLAARLVDEHATNRALVPGLAGLDGVADHVRAAAVIALRATLA
ncbi:MAG: hypothetical protein GXO15_01690 [Crenarchaeota archaeon]|nr:hypothetical protein [Thermoproteota archaeon]